MHRAVLPSSRFRRLRESVKHPDQAAIAARLPVIGRRVPMRALWRHRPIDARRMFAQGRAEAMAAGSKVIARGAPIARSVIERGRQEAGAASSTAITRGGPVVRRVGRNRMLIVVMAMGIGAFVMYWLDPQAGRRRRALVRDRLAHARSRVTHGVPRTAQRRGRFLRGVAKGIRHDAAAVVHRNGRTPAEDDVLVARVRSEALRGTGVRAGEIHVEAYEGCVTLRGQIAEACDIDRIVRATKHIDGVREVRNYLHTPGTPPPNKGDVYEHVPAHMANGVGF